MARSRADQAGMAAGGTAEVGLPPTRSERAKKWTKGNLMKRLIGYFKDERGVETLEWIVVGALIVAVGIAVYTGALQGSARHCRQRDRLAYLGSGQLVKTDRDAGAPKPWGARVDESLTNGRRKTCSRQYGRT